ncbi:MAG: hypothetical protein KTR19_09805 [Hyphomicrobiales bacterium]|nr:hypothetical protein [Hyphomicrobiales bacterium]
MDPDLVRQQAEAELEENARPPDMVNKVAVQAKSARIDAAVDAAAPPAAMMTAIVAYVGPETKPTPSRWRVHVQNALSVSALSALTGLAAAVWGSHQGLSPQAQIMLGSGAGLLMAAVHGVLASISGNGFTPKN